MKNLNLPDCPFCRSEAGYLESFTAKNKEIHRCTNCGRISKVKIDSAAFRFFVAMQIASIIIFIFAVIFGGVYCLIGLGAVTLFALAFYAFTPFAVRFVKRRCDYNERTEDKSVTHDTDFAADNEKEIYSN